MNDTQKKVLGGTAFGAGAGFALGWFLHRPKAASQIVLSNLVITPTSGNIGTVVTISVTAHNTGPAATALLVAMFGHSQLEVNGSFAPGESKTVTWTAADDGTITGSSGLYPVAVSVNPLLGMYQEVVPI
jgi:hypothetical protein